MIDVLVPEEQEGTKAVVRAWLKQVGDRVEENDPLVELETDKVAMEVPAPAAGVLREILLHTDDDAVPGAILGRIAPVAEVGEPETPLGPSLSKPAALRARKAGTGLRRGSGRTEGRETRLSPSVKRAVLQHDLDPAHIEGTGRGGRITRADVDRAVEQATQVSKPVEGVIPAAGRRHPLPLPARTTACGSPSPRTCSARSPRRRTSPRCSRRISRAIIAHREAHKAAYAKKGVKLTYTAYLVAAAAEAMKVAPAINSRWHADRLELYDDINIGVGTALGEKGLIVPVVRKVQQLSLKGIAAQLDELIEKARREKLTGADISGGTFTISNHGVSGSLFAAPIIINQPQSAILGVGKLEKRVVVREVGGVDAIQIRPMAYVSLTIDHRVVDGHQTNAWLSRFVEVLESWPLD